MANQCKALRQTVGLGQLDCCGGDMEKLSAALHVCAYGVQYPPVWKLTREEDSKCI